MGNKGSSESIVSLKDDDNERYVPTPQPRISKSSLKFVLNVLQKLPLAFDKDSAQKLLYQLEEKNHSPGDTLLKKGEMSAGIFIVLTGKCNVVGSNGKSTIRQLKAGNYFGEISCLYNVPSTCCVNVDEKYACVTVLLTSTIVKEILNDPEKQLAPMQSWFIKQGYLDVSGLFPTFDLPRAILKKNIYKCPLFHDWSKDAVSEVVDQLPKYIIEIHQTDTCLLFENDSIWCVFLLLEGSIELSSKGVPLLQLEAHGGECISLCEENLFCYNQSSVYSFKVTQLSHCVTLHQEYLDLILKNFPIESAKLMEWKKLWQEFLNVNSNLVKNDLAVTHPRYIIKLFKEKGNIDYEIPMVYLYEMSLRMDFFFAENKDQVMKIDSDYDLDPLIFVVPKGELVISIPSSSDINVKSNEIFYLSPKFPVKTMVITKEESLVGVLSKSLINELNLKYNFKCQLFS